MPLIIYLNLWPAAAMKIASMHAPIKIGTSIDAINLYERHSLLGNVYVLLIFINERRVYDISDFYCKC